MRVPIKAWRWWAVQLDKMASPGLTRWQTGLPNAVIIAVDRDANTHTTVLMRRRGQEVALGDSINGVADRLAGKHLVVLRPPSSALLERQFVLPQIVESDLRRLMGYEISRQTPFAADEVFWTCSVVHRERTKRRMHVRLSLVPKAPLLPLLAMLEQAGLAPSVLEASPLGEPPRIIPIHRSTEQTRGRRSVRVWIAGACAALALGSVALPFVLQRLALMDVTRRITSLRPAVAEVEMLRQRIAAVGTARNAIVNERAKIGSTLEALAAVTDLLPDDTVLNLLVLSRRELTISGQSAAAPKLIAALAADPRFRNPTFVAPVIRNSAAHTDLFSIHTELRP